MQYNTGCLSIFWFHQFSGKIFRAQFQIFRVGAPLFSGGAVYVYFSCWKIDGTGILIVNLYVQITTTFT